MMLTRDHVRGKAANDKSFQRGEAYSKDKKIDIYQVDQFWKGEVGVKAKVSDSHMEEYKVTLLVKNGKIYEYTCTCPAYKEYKGMCKHCVGTALEYIEHKGARGIPKVSTSPGFRNMLREYTSREVVSILSQEEAAKVLLVPKLTLGRLYVKAEFRIGRDRFYVLKDLIAFTEAMERGILVEYGKKLSFYHSLSAFQEESKPLLGFVQELTANYREAWKSRQGYGNFPVLREIELNRSVRDRFMQMLENQWLELEGYKGEKRKVFVVSENPVIPIVLKKKGKDGIELSINSSVMTFLGENHLYLCTQEMLYICDDSYSQAMGIFFQELINIPYVQSHVIEINQKDIPAFCAQILPKLQAYTEIEAEEGLDFDSYQPAPLKVELKLDSNDPDEITLEPMLSYGDYRFPAVLDAKVPATIYRDVSGELKVSEIIKKYFKNKTSEGTLIIRDDEDSIFRFLEEGISEFMTLGEVQISDSFQQLKVRPSPKITIGISTNQNWLNLTVDIGDMSREELQGLLENYRRNKKYHRLKSGEFIRLGESGISAAAELAEGLHLKAGDFLKPEIEVPKFRAFYLDKVLKTSQGVDVNRDSWFKSVIRGMNSVEDSDFKVPGALVPILRGYQKIGFRWLKTLDYYGFGGILADDMGLGKTIQVIALLLSEKEESGKKNASLIVCPASLVYNWESEIAVFGFGLKSLVLAGHAKEREEMLKNSEEYDVFVTSYDLLKRDIDLYKDKEFRFQIIDEAQFIKNAATQSAKAVKAIKAQSKFALTGTPIENRLSELWSIFDYLMPGFLYSYQKFREELESPIVKEGSPTALKRLHRMIDPFLLRRLKQDVLKDLPDKIETVVMTKFEEEQKKLYLANALELKKMLEDGSDLEINQGKLRILAELTKLRQICCDPSLLYANYHGGSAKLEICMELLKNGIEGEHKILIFSQFTSMLSLVEEQLKAEKIAYYIITGATTKTKRSQLVSSFNKDKVPVFLISLKAGGTGLNLTAADLVIHYDPWWNVAAQNQATDRAHRIGQKNVVSVFKLIAKDTIEENILKLQESKKNLTEQVLSENMTSLSGLSREDLLEILG